jgi:lipopolysaccharide/colanic/teichoic acid biosynthesis glycosyltransferase
MMFESDSQATAMPVELPRLGQSKRAKPVIQSKDNQIPSIDMIYAVDAAAALVLAVITLPILSFSLLWVLLVNFGNPFFLQTRIGRHGKPYRIFKVRTMRHDNSGHARFCAREDERILPGGHFLRKSRIDELPQLFNVLIGQMALVGPRPEQPSFVQSFRESIPRYDERMRVKPGITGLAQISQGYVDSLRGTQIKLHYDLFYIQKRSLKLWLFVVTGTVGVVIFRQGAR